MKFYQQLNSKQKKSISMNIEKVNESRKHQIKLIENNLLKPLRECIAAGRVVKSSQMSVEEYVRLNDQATKQLLGFFTKHAEMPKKPKKAKPKKVDVCPSCGDEPGMRNYCMNKWHD